VTGSWYSGNAADDGKNTRGWILGHFIEPTGDVRSSNDVEVKWGIHPAGDQRAELTSDDQRTTMIVLVDGVFRIIMERQGDYAVWGAGIDHSW